MVAAMQVAMVGTSATRRPSRFHWAICPRSAPSSLKVWIIGRRRAVRRETAVAHGVGKGTGCTGHRAAFGKEILTNLAAMTAVQAEEIVQHQHLAVALRAGTDADGRHLHRSGHLGGNRGRRTQAP